VSVVSWSLLTVHTNHAIALQFMQGSYNDQQRLLTSKKDIKFHSVTVWVLLSRNINNLVRKMKSGPGVFLEFCRARKKGVGGKSKTRKIMIIANISIIFYLFSFLFCEPSPKPYFFLLHPPSGWFRINFCPKTIHLTCFSLSLLLK